MTSNSTCQDYIDLIGIKNYWIIININLQNSLCSFIPALNDSFLLCIAKETYNNITIYFDFGLISKNIKVNSIHLYVLATHVIYK